MQAQKSLVAMLLISGLLTLPAAAQEEAASPAEVDVPPTHDFTLPARDGTSISLSSYEGKKVLAIFWASW